MHDYLTLWSRDLVTRNSFPLNQSFTILGERNQHLGPRCQKAKVWLTVQPAETFEVIDNVPANSKLEEFGYPEWVIFGLLDILLVALSAPIRNIRITLEKAEYDPIDSSSMAFRHAGRDAGHKIIEAVKSAHRGRVGPITGQIVI